MKHDEAKFLLRARRPGARDADDAMFADALKEAAHDPKLQAWHEAEQRFDAAVAAKLEGIAPPPGLRDAILTGARASGAARRRWRQPAWLALAAALALGIALFGWKWRGGATVREDLAAVALRDLAEAHASHVGHPAELAAVQARLADAHRALRVDSSIDLDELRREHCRTVTIAGHEVFEICFHRQGAWYHLYATRGRWGDGALREVTGGRLVAAAWSDHANSYALVTDAGHEALQRVL